MGKVLIKNAKAIVTCDVKDQVFYDCDMLIDGPKIAAIGKNIEADDAEIIHAEGKFVYPGLVNTHHHFFQTFVRNLTAIDYPNMLVMDWIDKIYRIFQKIDDNVIYYSSLTAMADLLKHGCTTAFDHQYCYTTSTGKRPVDRQMERRRSLVSVTQQAAAATHWSGKTEVQFRRRWSNLQMNLSKTVSG